MRRSGRIAIALLIPGTVTFAVAKFEQYVPRTLQSVIEANRATFPSDSTHLYTADNFPTRARVVYQGKVQPIPPSRLEYIAEYLGKVRNHPEWVAHYIEEILVREGDTEFWLPIQSPVLAYFKKEVTEGAAVDLYVTWIGAKRVGDQIDWIFTANEFQVPKPDPATTLPVSWDFGSGPAKTTNFYVGERKVPLKYDTPECLARFTLEKARHELSLVHENGKDVPGGPVFLSLTFRKHFRGDFKALPRVTIVQPETDRGKPTGRDEEQVFPFREKKMAAPVDDWSAAEIDIVLAAPAEIMNLHNPMDWRVVQVACD